MMRWIIGSITAFLAFGGFAYLVWRRFCKVLSAANTSRAYRSSHTAASESQLVSPSTTHDPLTEDRIREIGSETIKRVLRRAEKEGEL